MSLHVEDVVSHETDKMETSFVDSPPLSSAPEEKTTTTIDSKSSVLLFAVPPTPPVTVSLLFDEGMTEIEEETEMVMTGGTSRSNHLLRSFVFVLEMCRILIENLYCICQMTSNLKRLIDAINSI